MINILGFKTFKILSEAIRQKPVVVAVGRMNPISVGHLKLMEKMLEIGRKNKADVLLFSTHSHDAKKNPLTYDEKMSFIEKCAPSGIKVMRSNAKNVFQVLEVIAKLGVTKLIFVAGSDRIHEYEKMSKYMPDLGITDYSVVSAGDRDLDADGVVGMSASKLRKLAADGNLEEFLKGSALKGKDGEAMYRAVRKGMQKD